MMCTVTDKLRNLYCNVTDITAGLKTTHNSLFYGARYLFCIFRLFTNLFKDDYDFKMCVVHFPWCQSSLSEFQILLRNYEVFTTIYYFYDYLGRYFLHHFAFSTNSCYEIGLFIFPIRKSIKTLLWMTIVNFVTHIVYETSLFRLMSITWSSTSYFIKMSDVLGVQFYAACWSEEADFRQTTCQAEQKGVSNTHKNQCIGVQCLSWKHVHSVTRLQWLR